METYTEHKENDSKFRKRAGESSIRHESRCVGPHHQARQKVADNWRESDLLRHESQKQSGRKAAGKRQNQLGFVHRILPLLSLFFFGFFAYASSRFQFQISKNSDDEYANENDKNSS